MLFGLLLEVECQWNALVYFVQFVKKELNLPTFLCKTMY